MILFILAVSILPETREAAFFHSKTNFGEREVWWKLLSNLTRRRHRRRWEAYGELCHTYKNCFFSSPVCGKP